MILSDLQFTLTPPRHLQAVETQCGLDPNTLNYTQDSVQDEAGLISIYLAIMTREHVEDGHMRPPGFTLPSPESVNMTGNLWRAVSSSYSFLPPGSRNNTCYMPPSLLQAWGRSDPTFWACQNSTPSP